MNAITLTRPSLLDGEATKLAVDSCRTILARILLAPKDVERIKEYRKDADNFFTQLVTEALRHNIHARMAPGQLTISQAELESWSRGEHLPTVERMRRIIKTWLGKLVVRTYL